MKNVPNFLMRNAKVLLLLISLLTFLPSFSQLIITNGSWHTNICKGDIETYTIVNCTTGVIYYWQVIPSTAASIKYISPCEVEVQWLDGSYPAVHTLYATDGTNNGTLDVMVYDVPEPYVTSTAEVMCQTTILRDDGLGNVILDDGDGYVNICENSEVDYTVHGSDVSGMTKQFDWALIGGYIVKVDNNQVQPSTTYSSVLPTGTDQTITVEWGSTVNAYIKVTETILYYGFPLCSPKSKTVYLNIIESPVAEFTMDNTSLAQDTCYDICLNHEVGFINESFASLSSPIESWSWDFGDGSPINSQENPVHKYTTPGMFEVTLTVVNICNCESTITKQICVDELEAPKIFCPGVTCEGHNEIYHTDANCKPYTWYVAGGTFNVMTDPAYIDVNWNNVGPDGFGYIYLDGSNCLEVCDIITPVRVPVLLLSGTIKGPIDVCVDEYYTYKLPAWPATNYKWEISNNTNGATIFSSYENGYLVEIHTGADQGSFTLSCEYYNTISNPSCTGTAQITVNVKLKPEITGPGEICINSPCTCTVSNPPPTSGSTDWKIIHPNCSTFSIYNSTTSSVTFPASVFTDPGTYTIEASNPGNFCDPEPYTLEVVDRPEDPLVIYGTDEVCPNYPYTYSTDVLQGSVTQWIVTGGTIQGSSIGNSVTVIWGSTNPKSLSAYREWEDVSGCTSDTIEKPIDHIVVSGSIDCFGFTTVCQDQTYSYELILNNNVAGETYNWKIYSGSLIVGSISSGQGTPQCEITYLHLGLTTSFSFTLVCEVTKCGIVTIISLPITIEPNPTITSLTASPNPVCSKDYVLFDAAVNVNPATTDITWDFGDGSIPITAASSTQVTHFYTNTGSADQIFTVTAQATSSCNNTVSSVETIDVSVKPEPNAWVTPGGVISYQPPLTTPIDLFCSNSAGNFSYQWMFDDLPIGGPGYPILNATNQIYQVTSNLPSLTPPAPQPTTINGDYWCVVTDTTTGCDKETNRVLIKECDCNGPPCTPVGPAGINNFTVTLTACGQLQATCNTLGTIGVNIVDYEWIVYHGAASYTSTGTATQHQSQYYTFNKPGIYTIELLVHYVEQGNPGGIYTLSASGSEIVPYIAEMQWGLTCNTSNNGYVLLLEDFSSVFPSTSISQWEWKLDGNNIGSSPTCTTAVITGATQTIELIVSNGSSYPCTTSMQVVVPNLPVADYSTTTTYNDPFDPFKSCEGREIEFTNNSTPVNNIIFNEWDFKDGTISHMVHPKKEYFVSNDDYFNIQLTVTDKQGCKNDVTKTIEVYNNKMAFATYPYDPADQPVCYPSAFQSISYSLTAQGQGTPPYTHQWYSEMYVLQGETGQTLLLQPTKSSTYWVKITDANYCVKDINPTPAKVSVKYGPSAIIEGKQDVCAQEEFTLKAITGYPALSANITYSWDCPGCGSAIPADKIITLKLDAGVYTFELTVDDLNSPCTTKSGSFTVTVHDLPAKPSISLSVIECSLYELELTGSSSVVPTPAFNWSNGDCGQTSTIYHGGAYRLYITDEHGCRSYEDIDVPLAPNYYFWRFPVGCYTYCADDLPKKIDGPAYVIFDEWIWYSNGIPVINNTYFNNIYAGHGTGTDCDPLVIDLPHNGEGPGEYKWGLNNGLCYQESDIMVWDTVDCCELEMDLIEFTCADNEYTFKINAIQDNCDVPTFDMAVVDNNGLALTTVTINQPTPNILPQGILTTIEGEFQLNPPLPSFVTFEIKVNCYPYPCTDKIENVPLPNCTKTGLQNPGQGESDNNKKTEKANLDIVPNPAKSQTNIHYRFPETGSFVTEKREIKIFDTMGRPVTTVEINDTQGVYTLDLNKYSPGIYFVELNSNNQRVLTRRMIIYH